MKPPIATLRLDGHITLVYIDDLINIGLTFDESVKKRHNINKGFELTGVYYPSRQIYILTKTRNNISTALI